MAFGGAIPVAVAVVLAIWFIYGLHAGDFQPFAAQLAFIVMIFVQIAIMTFPLIAPPSLTINQAASPPSCACRVRSPRADPNSESSPAK